MWRVYCGLALIVVGTFALVTLVALEGKEVVVLRTLDDHGAVRETRTWVADDDGRVWIEAANSERPFLRDLQVRPDVSLIRDKTVTRCKAAVEPNPAGHVHIRRLLGAKYGWADRWVAQLTDTSGSLAVQLDCE